MQKVNCKDRCEKKELSKCQGICRTYNKIQTVFADMLESDEEIVSFECHVLLKGTADDMYTTDFVAVKTDGTKMVRECVWRNNLRKPSYARLLDISRNYWLSQGVTDWGIVIEKKEDAHDEGE